MRPLVVERRGAWTRMTDGRGPASGDVEVVDRHTAGGATSVSLDLLPVSLEKQPAMKSSRRLVGIAAAGLALVAVAAAVRHRRNRSSPTRRPMSPTKRT